MDYTNLKNMVSWERQKAFFITEIATELGMDINGYGILDVNGNSGYTYLWLEDYNFTLYMPINCELQQKDIYALWTNSYNGEEHEISIENMDLKDIEEWAMNLEETESIKN